LAGQERDGLVTNEIDTEKVNYFLLLKKALKQQEKIIAR
jgi:hypothetical protein